MAFLSGPGFGGEYFRAQILATTRGPKANATAPANNTSKVKYGLGSFGMLVHLHPCRFPSVYLQDRHSPFNYRFGQNRFFCPDRSSSVPAAATRPNEQDRQIRRCPHLRVVFPLRPASR